MGPKKGVGGPVVIDTNVFVIDLRYTRDRNYRANKRFLSAIEGSGRGVTTVYNLLETCGVLSFNLNEQQLVDLFAYLGDRYGVRVLPLAELEAPLPFMTTGQVFDRIRRRAPLGDALILTAIEEHVPDASAIVSWDTEHLRHKTELPVLTPRQFLSA